MKYLIMVVAFIMSFSNPGYANSGPVFWKGNPSFEVLTIEKDNSISVENERLIFDFTKAEHLNTIDYTRYGLVTAKYSMLNNSSLKKNVQMAFPFISSLHNFNTDKIKISSGNENIPYEILLGKDSISDNYDFENIISSINKDIYMPNNYRLEEVGTLYTYDINAIGDSNIFVSLKYNYDAKNSKIIADGFNSYSWGQDMGYAMRTHIDGNTRVQIFIIGEEIEFDIRGYNDGGNTKETEDFTYNLNKEKMSIRNYLNNFIQHDEDLMFYNSFLANNQLFNLYLKELDNVFSYNNRLLMLDDLIATDYWDRIFILLYEVEFGPNEEKSVEISYETKGTMDKTSIIDPLYRYEYLINPARNWRSFKDLHIEIIPPKDYPYIIDSSIDLNRNEEGIYIGFLEELPENDFYFSLYSKEKITLLDKINGKLRYDSFIASLVIFIGVPLVRILYRFIKRMIKRDEDY